jgi:RimJ/RimL family protein N-acetyltransferase
MQHCAGLQAAIGDGELWKLHVTLVPHMDAVPQFITHAHDAFAKGSELAFATIDKASGRIAGSTRFMRLEFAHRRGEIGFTFLAKTFQRTRINTEAKLLMLTHAFQQWGFNRVELLTDVLNDSSRNAISRLGAQQEGILRNHMVMRDGRVRDSVLYSIIRSEWPAVKQSLRAKLDAP